MLGGNLALSF